MTSTDFLNYALGISSLLGTIGTGSVALAGLLKTSKIEKHTNGMVEVLNKQAAAEARIDERRDNVARGGTTGDDEKAT